MKQQTVTVSFRLPVSEYKLLSEKARQRGLSAGVYARVVLVEELLGASEALLFEECRETRALVEKLGQNLKVVAVALLADAGKASVDEAETFVRESLS